MYKLNNNLFAIHNITFKASIVTLTVEVQQRITAQARGALAGDLDTHGRPKNYLLPHSSIFFYLGLLQCNGRFITSLTSFAKTCHRCYKVPLLEHAHTIQQIRAVQNANRAPVCLCRKYSTWTYEVSIFRPGLKVGRKGAMAPIPRLP